jgi:hypothetical protein
MKTDKSKLNAALRAVSPVKPREAGDFWEDFRARATLVPQEKPVRRAIPRNAWLVPLAAAALALVIVAVGHLLPHPDGTGVAEKPTAKPTQVASRSLSKVEDVQVFVDNASVTVFEDSKNGGTVVFVESAPTPNHI